MLLTSSSIATALGAASLLLSLEVVEAGGLHANLRQPAAVYYRGRNDCPELCSVSGPDPSNWTAYHSKDQLAACQETLFYYMSIYDVIDDYRSPHRIFACTSFGNTQKPGVEAIVEKSSVQTLDNASFTLGRWNDNAPTGVDLRVLSKGMRQLLSNGYAASDDRPLVLFTQTISSTAGLYIGKGIHAQSTASKALIAMENAMYAASNTGGSLAMQLCNSGYNSDHVFGFIATSNKSFTPVQQALQSWSLADCLNFSSTQEVISTAIFTTPLLSMLSNSTTTTNSTYLGKTASSFPHRHHRHSHPVQLNRRDECTTIQVSSGDTCATLAIKCGITAAEFTTYNPSSSLCSSLIPREHVCCSSGTMPDFTPTASSNGSCATYTIQADDDCADIAAAYNITKAEIESYNENTWGWNGCSLLYVGDIICLSSGDPPMPASLANAECGPQVAGTKANNTSDLSDLNPCPLNACCDVWGQCGITAEYCTNSSTGAPGTAKNGTNGCISNCGTKIIESDAPEEFISLAYYEGYGMDRDCLYQDVRQISTSTFTHLHFAFGVLSANYSIDVGSDASTYEFDAFKNLDNVKRVISFGGWAFSTDTDTYSIFREGVTAANRKTLASSIVKFVKEHDLDGVDIDWEYPGEPDIPGIPAGSDDDGTNYLEFLVVLKNLLPNGKTLSIAAPASYWYLKAFPIAKISKVVDYIVFMAYDLHGQWDAGNQYAQDGCSSGNCLRSHINLTETKTALSMITKAGVASNKVVVGVSSYGRSFAMAEAGCYTANCLFTGTAYDSDAEVGVCTATAGYIADAEINDIINKNSSRVTKSYLDTTSNSRILVYDDTQWVAYMDDDIRTERTKLYKGWKMGGTTNWASDLETYNDAPDSTDSWKTFFSDIELDYDPYAEGNRTGNWTDITCDTTAVQDMIDLTPEQRWSMLDGSDAWADVISVYKNYDRAKNVNFTQSVMNTLHGDGYAECGSLLTDTNCDDTKVCAYFTGDGTGAIAYEIWNSMVLIHEMYKNYYDALFQVASTYLDPALATFEDDFAPIPKSDDLWLEILLGVVDLVGTVGVGTFFNGVLKELQYWKDYEVAYDNVKDGGQDLVRFSVTITEALTSDTESGSWTPTKQNAFSTYMGEVINAWAKVTETACEYIFNGSDTSISLLTTLMGSGQFLQGDGATSSTAGDSTALQESIARSLFAYTIPQLWNVSGTRAFVLNTGSDCSNLKVGSDYLSADTMNATAGCYDEKLYYLVYPKGDSTDCTPTDGTLLSQCVDNDFSAPPGVDTLDGSLWGGLTVADLIAAAVNTYVQNGNANGGSVPDLSDDSTLDDLMDGDITTPGFVRLPVCSETVARAAWDDSDIADTVANYPCYVKPSISDCGTSTFVDQTSDASPPADDCLQIVKNIEGTQGSWEVENAVGAQHQLVQYGDCKFGVQGLNKDGNVDFHIGAQDIVDIINDSISKFNSTSGKVGAKGEMNCNGDIDQQAVEWGLY